MKYYHTLFNQKVESEIELPEADKIEKPDKVDIQVVFDKPPSWVFEKIAEGDYDYIAKDVMWFHLEGFAIYYVENGNKIIIHKESETFSELALRSYLTGTAFALALMQKDLIPIHGGAIVADGKGVIISGTSGSGKSTISMALLKCGFDFLTDDISVVDLESESTYLLPGFPQQKVCRDAISQFQLEESELIYIDEDRDKFAKRLRDKYISEPVRINCMFEIIVSDQVDNVEFIEVSGINKLHQLMNNIYRGEVYQRIDNNTNLLKNLLLIASQMKMYQIRRPYGVNSIDEIVEKIRYFIK